MKDPLPAGMTRRTMLKATAATTVGAALFSGSASATETKQINWCGCSQVCVEDSSSSRYLVITAEEDGDGWTFEADSDNKTSGGGFCNDDGESGEKKIIAVVPFAPGQTDGDGDDTLEGACHYANPGRCAHSALEAYTDPEREDTIPIVGEIAGGWSGGLAPTTACGGEDVTIVEGSCGEPGKDNNRGGRGRGRN